MSAQNVSWSNIQKDLITSKTEIVKGCTTCVYSPKVQKFTFGLSCWSGLLESLFADLQATAKKHVAANPASEEFAFPIEKIDNALSEDMQQIITINKLSPKEGKEQKSDKQENGAAARPSETGPSIFGLTPKEQIETLEKVKEAALKWFRGKSVVLEEREVWQAPADKILKNTARFDIELHNFFYKQFGLRCSKNPTAYSIQDFAFFGLKPEDKEKVRDPRRLSCAQFALLKTRELRAREHIFTEDLVSANKKMLKMHEILHSWGYTPVETPDDNDLVMYVNDAGQPRHLGRYIAKEGKVESKLGVEQTHFHWHALFDVPKYYGSRVVFWRKPSTQTSS